MPKKCRQSDLPPDAIERCVRTVELVLRDRGNRDEAVAAIDRLFGEAPTPPPSLETSVHDIGLGLRTASLLDDAEIITARDLQQALASGRLWSIPRLGIASVQECQRALDTIVATSVPHREPSNYPAFQSH
jgi:hypothetical protein